MRAASSLLLLAAIIGLPPGVFAQGPATAFHSFDFPGATDTQATSMSPWGDIVGRYFNSDGSQHGFLLQRGRFFSIDVPGAVLTDVDWINDRGVIVGYYSDGQFNHGFQLSNGRFSTIDYPGSQNTIAAGISSDGDIVGGVSSNNGTDFRGFLLRRGIYSSIVFPGSSVKFQESTMIAAGHIVGGYLDADGAH